MKKRNKTILRMLRSFIIFCLIAMSITGRAQNGISCTSALNFSSSEGAPAIETQVNISQWYHLVGTNTRIEITRAELSPTASSKLQRLFDVSEIYSKKFVFLL